MLEEYEPQESPRIRNLPFQIPADANCWPRKMLPTKIDNSDLVQSEYRFVCLAESSTYLMAQPIG